MQDSLYFQSAGARRSHREKMRLCYLNRFLPHFANTSAGLRATAGGWASGVMAYPATALLVGLSPRHASSMGGVSALLTPSLRHRVPHIPLLRRRIGISSARMPPPAYLPQQFSAFKHTSTAWRLACRKARRHAKSLPPRTARHHEKHAKMTI